MTSDEEKLLAICAALQVGLRVSLASHPDRIRVIQELAIASQKMRDFLPSQPLSDKAIETAESVIANLIQSLTGDFAPGKQ